MSSNTGTERKKSSHQNIYIGKAGQLAVMAELAFRGYNVSLPEIDKGDDIFVVNDITRELWRIQVKGATPQQRNGNYQVVILEKQITTKPKDKSPDLHFVFALRTTIESDMYGDVAAWRFVVMTREQLRTYIDERESVGKKLGSLKKKDLRRTLGITFDKKTGEARCSRTSWGKHVGDWTAWPFLDHDQLADVETAALTISGAD
jgi:hypothetical protein